MRGGLWGGFIMVTALLLASPNRGHAQISYTTPEFTYTQSFDTLPNATGTHLFTNNSTITGFYGYWSGSNATTGGIIRGGADTLTFQPLDNHLGTSATTGSRVVSFGATGETERAIGGNTGPGTRGGSTPSATPGDYYYAFVFRNNTNETLDSFTVSYAGEQWVEASGPTTTPQSLRFDYLQKSTFDANADIPTSGSFGAYTPVTELSFSSPENSRTEAGAIVRDGNHDTYRDVLTKTIATNWAPGDYLILRFWDDDSSGNDHGLAIDDFNFAAAVPEPASASLILVVAMAAVRRRRRIRG